jgi:hypothetical protein
MEKPMKNGEIIGFEWVLLFVSMFFGFWILMNFYWMFMNFIGCSWILLDVIEFYRMVMEFNEFYV